MRDYAGAETALLRATKTAPRIKDGWLWLGKTQLALGKIEDSARSLETARRIAPNDESVLYNLGQAYSRLSQAAFKDLFQAAPESNVAQLLLAQANTEREQFPAAIRRFQQILASDPSFPGIHEALGAIYLKQSNLPGARDEFEAELKMDPDNEAALTQLGAMLVEKGELTAAESLLAKAVKLNPHLFPARLARGRALMELRRPAEALADLEIAEKLEPETARVYFQKSRALAALGRAVEATAARTKFKELVAREETVLAPSKEP